MRKVTTIGLDLAKNVFQVHGVDASGKTVIRRQLRRRQVLPFFKKQPPCLVGMEACATAHHWARELAARQRTMLVNAIRSHMAEFGVVARVGLPQVKHLLAVIADSGDDRIPPLARICLTGLATQLMSLEREISAAEQGIHAWHRSNEASRRLETIPGIGPITASALTASITDPAVFKSGREMAAWIGLVPRQSSSGGKARLGRISKQGDHYLRWLLVAGAMTIIRHAKRRGSSNLPALTGLIGRRPTKVAAVALANSNARIAWALLKHGGSYEKPAAAPA